MNVAAQDCAARPDTGARHPNRRVISPRKGAYALFFAAFFLASVRAGSASVSSISISMEGTLTAALTSTGPTAKAGGKAMIWMFRKVTLPVCDWTPM